MGKDNIKAKLDRIFTWEGGQRLFNFAYSIGAAIVIWGALFKILHLPGGNTLLCIGMGTEVLMFILTAFDRPPKEYKWEKVFREFEDENPEGEKTSFGAGGNAVIVGGNANGEPIQIEAGAMAPGGVVAAGGVVPPVGADLSGLSVTEEDTQALTDSIHKLNEAAEQLSKMAELTTATQTYLSRLAEIANQMDQFRETTHALNEVSGILLNSYRSITDNSDDINNNSRGYIDQMSNLNRNIGGLNTIYEIQLKSVSSQLESIDRVNRGIKDIRDMYEKSAAQSARYCEETEKMSRLMQQLNQVYEKMVSAMTINMYRPMMNDIPGSQSSGMTRE